MKTRLLHFIEVLRSAFWLIPIIGLMSAVVLAVINIYIDRRVFVSDPELLSLLFYFNHQSSVQNLLATTASSVLGVAGVTFSITIASLTLASQQFGPRLLRNFMQDRFNQVVIGFFIGTFLYCMLLLQFTANMDTLKFTPIISMLTVLALIVVDLMLLVFFIHHVASSIQADSVIAEVQQELEERLLQMYPDEIGMPLSPVADLETDSGELFDKEGRSLLATHSGYLQAIDANGLRSLASHHGISLRIHHRAGDFLIGGSEIADFIGLCGDVEDLQESVNSHLIVGQQRTPEQDAEYAIRQLAEIALRALSPGINDPFTAIAVIHRIGDALAFIQRRRFPPDQYFDDDGQLQLVLNGFTYQSIIDSAFEQLRQNADYHVSVIITLLEVLYELAQQARTAEHAAAIQRQADATHSVCQQKVPAQIDLDDIQSRYDRVCQALNHAPKMA